MESKNFSFQNNQMRLFLYFFNTVVVKKKVFHFYHSSSKVVSKADQINGSFRRQARECRRSTRFTKQVQAHKVWAAKKEGHSGMGIIILIGKSNLPLAEVLPTWSYAGRPFDMTLCMARQRRFLKKRSEIIRITRKVFLFESSRLTRSFRAAGVKTTQAKNDCSFVFLNYLQHSV